MRGFANAGGAAGRVREGRFRLPRDVLEGVPIGRLLRCLLEVERGCRGVRLAGLGGSGDAPDSLSVPPPDAGALPRRGY